MYNNYYIGVGHCSVVHEGPHGIGTKKRNFDEALQIGMITSIEPGYYSYKDGFGIRIENLAYVVPVEENDGGNSGDDKYMTFQHLTMCPIETKLIDLNVMTEKQIEWLNNYHLDVRKVLSPRLKNNKQLLEWLIKKTEPIGAGQNKIEGKL
jgi:Xaa-Pro aminopeptidase